MFPVTTRLFVIVIVSKAAQESYGAQTKVFFAQHFINVPLFRRKNPFTAFPIQGGNTFMTSVAKGKTSTELSRMPNRK